MTDKLTSLVPILANTLSESLPDLDFQTLKVLKEVTEACNQLKVACPDVSEVIAPLINFYIDILEENPFAETAVETSIIINELSRYVTK